MYILKVSVDEDAVRDFRHLNFLPPGPVECATAAEVAQVLNNLLSTYTRKHRPYPGDVVGMVERIDSAERGISIFRPSVPVRYKYPGKGLRLQLSHIWQGQDCLVAANLHTGQLRKSPYGSGELVWRGPEAATEYEVWWHIDKKQALSIVSEWVAALERRFPGAAAVYEPNRIIKYNVPLEWYIRDDDGVMVLAVGYFSPSKLLLGTPVGWFDTDFWIFDRNVRSVYGLLKEKGIGYPRPKKSRRWTDEIAMQILMAFRLIAGGGKNEACGSAA